MKKLNLSLFEILFHLQHQLLLLQIPSQKSSYKIKLEKKNYLMILKCSRAQYGNLIFIKVFS